ncbi:MAG TPA: hypothetical protein VJL58_01930 [Pyrinomonadaceae bacterium]|nr:hypothetical protein [Pyrinomonadaceae bacterium]
MFCPDCGLEDKQANQFCRACGSDLRPLRYAFAQPDSITASAATARDEIGRAVAAKLRDTRSAEELSVFADEVLPEIEKFLESPEEKRLRRMRAGTIMSSIGFGTALAISLVAMVVKEQDMFFLAAMGLVLFFIGLGFILNGVFLTVPKKKLANKSFDADRQRALDSGTTNDLVLPAQSSTFQSVTENTTRHLKDKEPPPRD